jgi:hypothetical protein
VAELKPSPAPAALLAALVLAWIPILLAWPLLPRTALVYRGLDLADRATLLAAAGFLALETARTRGPARAVTAATALLAAVSRFVGVGWLTLLQRHGVAWLWAYGVPAAVGAVLIWTARRRAAAGG